MQSVIEKRKGILSWRIGPEQLGWVSLGFLYLFFLYPHMDIGHFSSHDPVSYIARAVSIWNGEGYVERFAEGLFPIKRQLPGLSYLLAPVVGLFGINFTAMKLFMVFLALGLAFSSWIFFRYFLDSEKKATWAMMILMAGPVIFGLSHSVLAEIPLFTCILLALVSMEKYLKNQSPVFSRGLYWSAAFAAAAFYFKPTIGLLGCGWFLFIHPAFRNRDIFKKMSALSALLLIPILLWVAWCMSQETIGYWGRTAIDDFLMKNPYAEGSGLASAGDWLIRIKRNLVWGMMNNLGAGLIAPLYFTEGSRGGFAMGTLMMSVMAIMWFRTYRRAPSVLEGFVLFTFLIFVLKKNGLSDRFTATFYPVILVYTMRLLSAFQDGRYLRHAVFFLFALGFATSSVLGVDRMLNPYGSKEAADYLRLAGRARDIFPADSTCVAPHATHWQLASGHLCFTSWDRVTEAEKALQLEADYFVVLSPHAGYERIARADFRNDLIGRSTELTKLFENRAYEFVVVASNDSFMIVEKKPGGGQG